MVQYLIFVRYQLLCFAQMKSSTRKYTIIDREKIARNFRREQRRLFLDRRLGTYCFQQPAFRLRDLTVVLPSNIS